MTLKSSVPEEPVMQGPNRMVKFKTRSSAFAMIADRSGC